MEDNQYSVQTLILKNKNITNMKTDIDCNLSELENLELSRNKIKKIENLKKAENLKKLILNENEIEILESKEIPNKIKELFLNENLLKKITLKNFENIKILSLSKNKITKIDFYNLKNLKFLDLSKNEIQFIDKQNLNNLKNLKEINLSYNKIEYLNFFDIHDKLQILNISNNKIKKINKKIILENLKILDLNNNQIKNIKNFDFSFPNLEILNLRNNLIEELIDIYSIDKMYKLREIYVKNNFLFYEGISEFILRLNLNLSIIDNFKKDKINFEIIEVKNDLKNFFTNEEIENIERDIDNNLDVFVDKTVSKDNLVFDDKFNDFISSFNDDVKINQKLINKKMGDLENYFFQKRKNIRNKENVYNRNYSNLMNGKKINLNLEENLKRNLVNNNGKDKKHIKLEDINKKNFKKIKISNRLLINKSLKKHYVKKPKSLKKINKNIMKNSEKKKILLRRNKDHENFMKCFQIKNIHPNSLKKQNEFLKNFLKKKHN